MKAISLFSGVGGFEIGLERAGVQTVLQAESDPWCLEVLARHWPDVERVNDVKSVVGQREPKSRTAVDGRNPSTNGRRREAGTEVSDRVDLVYGGFPCQDVSVAGNRAGLGGARSGLWSEFRRVLSELRPTWFCAENVPGLLSSNGGRDFGQILSDVDDLGYGVAWAVLDARWFGVPQRRRRVFIVGCLGNPDAAAAVLAVCESCGGHPAPSRETGQRIAAGADAGVAFTLPSEHRGIGNGWNTNHVIDQSEARALTARASGYRMDGETETFIVAGALRASDGHHGHSSPRGDGADNLITFDWQASAGNDESWRGKGRQHIVRSGAYAGAVSATRTDAIASPAIGVRRLTPLECERLMAFPDDHTRWTSDGREIPDSHRYRMCGNGVVATCAEWIGWRLMHVDRMLRGPV